MHLSCRVDEAGQEFVWHKSDVAPFEELILSWNAKRPRLGAYQLFLSVHAKEWSKWIPYALWGAKEQKSYHTVTPLATVFQDTLEAKTPLNGFRVKIIGHNTDLSGVRSLHACLTNPKEFAIQPVAELPTLEWKIDSLHCQRGLKHPRCLDLCSPTSTTMAVNFLSKKARINPLLFAKRVHDAGFDIYGNWAFNVAESFHRLGEGFSCSVERLGSFQELHQLLSEQTPVVVSVKGPMPGAPLPYAEGHLILVNGWDNAKRRVLCADPAEFNVMTSYAIEDFLTAWGRRRNLAYVFRRLKRTA